MKELVGVAYASPLTLKEYIDDYCESANRRITTVLIDATKHGDVKLNVNVVFTLSFHSFIEHMDSLDKSKAVVFLFDSPVVLSQANVPIMDAREASYLSWAKLATRPKAFMDKLTAMLKSRKQFNVSSLNLELDLITDLLASQGSITQTILTVTMACKSTGQRQRATRAFIDWLVSGKTADSLIDHLAANRVKVHESLTNVVEWFNSDAGLEARITAIKLNDSLSRGEKPNLDRLVKGTRMSAFDLNYLLHYLKTEG